MIVTFINLKNHWGNGFRYPHPKEFPSSRIQGICFVYKHFRLELSYVFFFFFVFETPLKDFPFYSYILVILLFGYLQIHIKESCMYISSQFFFKTPHETLKFQEKFQKNQFFAICRPKFQNFFLQCLSWSNHMEPLN